MKDALAARLDDVRAQGYVALKSIAATARGLAIREWTDEEAEAPLREYRRDGSARLAHKPLLDTLLHVAFAEAARQEVPVQFHCGYGDADTDLAREPAAPPRSPRGAGYRGMPVVLLHECYPYTREGGYLAAVYGNVYLDLSYGIPLLGYGEMFSFTTRRSASPDLQAPLQLRRHRCAGDPLDERPGRAACDRAGARGACGARRADHPEAEAAGEYATRKRDPAVPAGTC